MIGLTAEQQQLAKIVHDYVCRFPSTGDGDAQLLQGCYDYMEAFTGQDRTLSELNHVVVVN